MQMFQTPEGKAGSDQVDSMIESVHAEIEQMFDQSAKGKTLEFGVGRTTAYSTAPDVKIQLDAQKRECEAQIVFHAGRALELALQIIYARGTDRILGREYPGIDRKQMQKDTKKHELTWLYNKILRELSSRNMKDGFEDVYQHALHSGVVDLYLGETLLDSFYWPENEPFREGVQARITDGAEMTLDHSSITDVMRALLSRGIGESQFDHMPYDTFEEFLKKADAVYYESDSNEKRRNMRWANYSARDHESGRPYVVVGTEFFARLVKGIIELSHNQSTWHQDFTQRWHERRRHDIRKLMETHARQNFKEKIEFPEMVSIDEAQKLFSDPLSVKSTKYETLHKRYTLQEKI